MKMSSETNHHSFFSQEAQEAESRSRKRAHNQPAPKSNYKDKYQHLIGTVAAKEAAEATTTNRAYGFGESLMTLW